MKEFSAQTGGRYTYVDDVLNLQGLALAFASIFDGCDNFVVNGCSVNGTTVSEGYVYMNGKIRHFPGAAGIASWPQYIHESNSTETVAYANGADKVGRNVYGCAIAKTVPTVLDPLTNAVPQYILVTQSGGKQLKDALFGKYALILNSDIGVQEVKGNVNFTGNINVSGAITAKNKLSVQTGNSIGQIYYDENGNFIVQSRIGEGAVYRFIISSNNGFQFSINGKVVWEATDQSISNRIPVVGDSGRFGNIKTIGNYLYNDSVSDEGGIYINTLGYNGGDQYFRNTYIGNGKGSVVLEVNGKNASVNVSGSLSVAGSQPIGLLLKSNIAKSNVLLRKTISWTDSASYEMGYIGFNSVKNNVFEIHNGLADILITGLEAVNLGPAIMEDGTLLSKKYASITHVNDQLKQKANSNDVYSSTNADKTFAKLNGGLSQFINEDSGKAILRSQIDAVSLDEVRKESPSLNKFLADMATSEDAKKTICTNIGATYGSDYQKKLKDSGWIELKGGLYIRQIGNVVSIQGYITIMHSGTAFTIPNSIDPPTYAVNFSTTINSYSGVWRCHIDANSRNCTVDYCNNHGVKIPFSITYMV